ncbi:MAG: hypothetical protein K0B10_13740 [Vicingaceae bacterium]|nr:hypothetical protein [Vicingaceae bacterium]
MKVDINRIVLTFIIVLLRFSVFGQIDNEKDSVFSKIFGQEINYNDTSIIFNNKITIKHSVETCSIKAFKQNGQLKWETKLPNLNCKIIYFKLLENIKIKNSDILIQFENKAIHGINSKNGKITHITHEELEAFYN